MSDVWLIRARRASSPARRPRPDRPGPPRVERREVRGVTTAEIHERAPGWLLFTDGAPGGERPDDVGRRWLGWPVAAGRHFLLDTGTVSIVSAYYEAPAIKRWNAAVGR
jgi:probable phosphoglycerate mutase